MSASWLRILALMVASAWLAAGCSEAQKIEVGGTCILNTDCNQGLVCTWGKCHVACRASADCQPGQSCIAVSDQSMVCQMPTPCTYNSDCPTGLICAVDQQCRHQCQKDVDCSYGQTCTTTQTCAEPNQVDSNKNLLAPDGGISGSGGAAGAGGTGGGSDAGARDILAAQPDGPIGGTSSVATSVGGTSGSGGTLGTGGSISSNHDASVDVPADVSGSTGGASSVGGTSGSGGAPGTGGPISPNPDTSVAVPADAPGGGTTVSGGNTATGGTAGGANAAGGTTSTGGTVNTGGTTATGDTTSAGGTTSSTPDAGPDSPDAPGAPYTSTDVLPPDGGMPDLAPPATDTSGIVATSCGEIPGAGLVAYWGFEGLTDSDQSIPDLSGNGHTLTRGSTATADSSDPTFSTDTPCGHGSSVHLDGIDDFLWLLNDAALSPQELTLAAWARLDVVPSNPVCIAGNLGVWCSGNGYQLQFENGNTLEGEYRGSGASCSGSLMAALSGFVWTPGQWHHVATTLQSTGLNSYEARLYVDGVLRSTATGAAVDYTNTPRFLIGTNADGVGLAKTHVREWPGNIDEIVVYNRALSASEVAQLAGNGGSP